MFIKKIIVGPLESNCYIIGSDDTREAFVVDPGDEPDRIINLILEEKLRIKFIVCTHAHFDHVGAVPEIKEQTNAKIVIHGKDLELYKNIDKQAILWGYKIDPLPPPDVIVSEGDELDVGNLVFKILHTPGHSPGAISIYGEDILITGDTLFAGSVGRTDLYGGDIGELKNTFKRLMTLPDKTKVLPGHGPETTIGEERVNNFFLYEI